MEISNPILILGPILFIVGIILGKELSNGNYKFSFGLPKLNLTKKQEKTVYKPIKANTVKRTVQSPKFSMGAKPKLSFTKTHKMGLLAVMIIIVAVVALNQLGPISFTGLFVGSVNPSEITNFEYNKVGNDLVFNFGLADNETNIATTNGNATLKLIDGTNVLYEKNYTMTVEGDFIEDIATLNIDYTSLEKTLTGTANAILTFSVDGKTLESTLNAVGTPKFGDSELNSMSLSEYSKNAYSANQAQTKEGESSNFKVTLEKIGYYNKWTNGVEVKRIRADVTVKNVGDNRFEFNQNWNKNNNFKLTDSNSKVYTPTGDTTFRGGMLSPGESISGYLIFDDFDSSSNRVTLSLDSGDAIHYIGDGIPPMLIFKFVTDTNKF